MKLSFKYENMIKNILGYKRLQRFATQWPTWKAILDELPK